MSRPPNFRNITAISCETCKYIEYRLKQVDNSYINQTLCIKYLFTIPSPDFIHICDDFEHDDFNHD